MKNFINYLNYVKNLNVLFIYQLYLFEVKDLSFSNT